MQITILTVSKGAPAWVNSGVTEYSKRLPRELSLKIIEVTPVRRSKTIPVKKFLQQEGERIGAVIPKDSYVIALDEKGRQLDTARLARKMENWIDAGLEITFIVGGADGLAPAVKTGANEIWSLSNYTMPHALVRVVLVEQLYRAWTILKNHPYHRQ